MTAKTINIFSSLVEKIFRPSSFHWICFLAICLSDTWLSFGAHSPREKLAVISGGIILPLILLIFFSEDKKSQLNKTDNGKTREKIPFWLFFMVIVPAIILRLLNLTTLLTWPVKDEGIFGYFAVRLCQNWNWSLLQGLNQLPTLFTWLQAGLFKFIGPSLFSLWLFPALCSLLLLPLAWIACCQFFPEFPSFLILSITAFGFWPLFLGRFSTQAIFMVDWEVLAFLFLGSYLRSKPEKRNLLLLGLSLVSGIGFYTYLPWIVVSFMTGLCLWDRSHKGYWKRLQPMAVYGGISVLIALPLVLSTINHRFHYLGHLWGGGQNHHWEEHFWLFRAYLSDFFWGMPGTSFHYGPIWGGFLNPLVGSFFFLGLAAILRYRPLLFSFWCFSALAVFLIPGLFSDDFEDMRLIQIVPLLAVVSGLGLWKLVSNLSRPLVGVILFFLLSFSAGLDFYHLYIYYPRFGLTHPEFFNHHKTPEFYKAFQLLKKEKIDSGPGWIFLNFDPDPYDQTLYVATYPFNAAGNPNLESNKGKWAAILANVHEQPFLKQLFPDGRWVWLSDGYDRMDGGFLLQIVSINPQNLELLDGWRKADQSLSDLTYEVMETGVNPDQGQMLALLDRAYDSFKGDRLLESRYWRIRAIHEIAADHFDEAIADYKKAISLGYPMAHLYNELGCLLYKENRFAESQEAFEEALQSKPNCTNAFSNLQNLKKN